MKLLRRLLLAFFLIFIVRVYTGSFDSILTELFRSRISQNNIPCQLDSISVIFPFALRVNALDCQIPSSRGDGPPYGLNFYKAEIAPAWTKLLSLSPGIKLSVVPVSQSPGLISITLARSIRNGKSQLTVNFSKFPLASILRPGVVRGVSIEGDISGELGLNFSSRDDLEGQGQVIFENGSISASGMEKSIIKLPVLREVSFALPFLATNQSIKFAPITGASTFGVIKGEGSINSWVSKPKFSFDANLLLNERGMKVIGGFLALSSGMEDVTKPVEEWKISGTGDFAAPPNIKITPAS